MKNRFTLHAGTLLVASLLTCSIATAGNRPRLRLSSDRTVMVRGKQVKRVACAPESGSTSTLGTISRKSPTQRSWADGTTEADILIDEDFSAFTGGDEDHPDTTCLASYYTSPGMNIDPSLTHGLQWTGNNVYAAGGKVALISPRSYIGSTLSTPLGDYSGDLTITFKIKALVNSDIFVNVLKGGYSSCDDVKTPDGEDDCWTGRIYPKQGWKEVTVKITNYSADNDGFIQFQNYGTVIIDDVKITTTANFLADPHVTAETGFTGTSFTANWEPTHKAFNYYLNLYKKRYTGDSEANLKADFEDGTLPDDWSFSSSVADRLCDQGADDSQGLRLENGDTLTLPHNLAKLKDFSFWLYAYDPNPDEAEDIYSTEVALDFLTLSGWETVATLYVDNFLYEGQNIDLFDELKDYNLLDITDKYYGARIRVEGLPEGDYLVLDDVYAKTGRPAVLDQVFDPEFSDDSSGDEGNYDITQATSYTFKDLDPEGDYYYTVRAHYLRQRSAGNDLRHAFGVATPTPLVATDVVPGSSFTAHWTASPRATAYDVYTYGMKRVTESSDDYQLVSDDFAKVDSETTEATDPYAPESVGASTTVLLDDFTAQPGWTAYHPAIAQGMVGFTSGMGCYVATPELHTGKATQLLLKIKAYGTVGDAFVVESNSGLHAIYFYNDGSDTNPNHGVIDGTYLIPCTEDSLDQMVFYSAYNCSVILSDVTISRAVEAGENVYTFLHSKTVNGSETSLGVDDLNDYGDFGFDDYAFAVKAEISADGEYAESPKSVFQLISSQTDPTTPIRDLTSGEMIHEVARYTIDGKRITKPVRGLNIIKMSDGSVIRQIVNE